MSASSQPNNGKKSSNSSTVNTPASTPISNNVPINSQSSPPPNNAPKYGTLVPNRIFVGGISANTTEGELMQLFSSYGTVKAAKIIQDRAGVSRGYGFITFESEDDAKRPLREAENIVLRERKLNIAPAIKKQSFSRTFDSSSSPPAVAAGNPAQFFFSPHGAAVPFFHSGMAYYPQATPAAPGDPNTQQTVYQPPTVYPAQAAGPQQTATYPPLMFPAQPIYMPQQYPTVPLPYEYNYYQNSGGPPHYMVGGQGGPGGPQCPPIPQSNSPPRPHCYSQQMSYNPAETMFYNMPMYGTTMDGTPIYDTYDGTSGIYNEDPYNNVECQQQEVDAEISNSIDNTSSSDVNPHFIPHQQQPHVQTTQPLAVPQTPILQQTRQTTDVDNTANNNNNNVKALPQKSDASSHIISNDNNTTMNSNNTNVDSTRNTTTPVVSLLHIDQQQEKDYTSMQGGRKKKSPSNHSVHNHHPQHTPNYPDSGFINSYMYSNNSYTNGPPHGVCTFNGMPGNYGSQIVAVPFSPNPSRNGNINGTYDRMKRRRNFHDKRLENNSSSRSSIRTDSNSSASVAADENKNDENKQQQSSQQPVRTNVNTPPPLPYSPIAVTQNYIRYNNTSRSFSSNSLNRRSNINNNNIDKRTYNNNSSSLQNYHSKSYTPQHNQHQHAMPHTTPSTQSPISARVNNNNNNVNINSKNPDDVSNNTGRRDNNFNNSDYNKSDFVSSQVHTNQNFGTNNRRPRKQVRSRNNAGGNEIGAGDAPPMPNVDVSEVCKKMENLKV